MRSMFPTLLKSIFAIFCSAVIGTILLCLVYLLPVDKINSNIKESLPILEQEGVYPVLTDTCTSRLDNFTDSLMLLKARYQGKETPLEKALMVYHTDIINRKTPLESLMGIDSQNTTRVSYARYWHGYLLFLKPALILMNYQTLRYLNLLIQLLITFILIFFMYKNHMKLYIIPYIFSYALIMPWAIAWSMQFSSIFYIMSFSCIILIRNHEHWSNSDSYYYLFLFIGIVTSYLDLLTYPLVTFGIPITLYFCMKHDQLRNEILSFLKYLFAWGTGYVGMWSCKWIIATLLTDSNIILDGVNRIILRSSDTTASGENISFMQTLSKNYHAFSNNPAYILCLIFALSVILISIYNYATKKYIYINAIFIMIALLPFLWFMGACNHSYIHFWFTYKELMIFSFSGMCFCVSPLDNYRREST